MSKLKLKNIATVVSFLVVGIITYTLAYFSGTDAVTNRLVVGNVKIELIESDYDDLKSQDKILAAGQTMTKDPKIKNVGKNDVFVFLEVITPLKTNTQQGDNYILIDSDGKKMTNYNSPFEIFNFYSKADLQTEKNFVNKLNEESAAEYDKTYFSYDADWVLLEDCIEINTTKKQKTYIFGYKKRLSPLETTSVLFDYIQLKNVLENSSHTISDSRLLYDNIIVNAYGIQADDIHKDITEDVTVIPAGREQEILKELWKIYHGQGGEVNDP